MRTSALLCGMAAAAVFVAMPATLSLRGPPAVSWSSADAAVASIGIDAFFTTLAPYGAWIQSPDYNYVWVPTQVDADWSPYTSGHWVYTAEFGWYFASDDPYAWVVYHYGRWGYDQLIGWYWVPGTQWAPAWVAWRRGETSIGWAPLPPQGNGYALNVSITIGEVPQQYWRFVATNQFLAPQLRTITFAGDRRPDLYTATQPAGSVTVQNNIVINNVITVTYIEQQTKTKVVAAKVEAVANPKDAQGALANSPTSIKAFTADLAAPDKTVAPPKVVARTEVQAPTKGQAAVLPGTPAAKTGPAPGVLPDAPAAGSGTVNPRCTDATFAKTNPKDCAAPGAIAATPKATDVPPANAPAGNAAPASGALGPPPLQGSLTPAKPGCADPAFAKANPKDCPVEGTVVVTPDSGAKGTAPAAATSPPLPAVQGNAGPKADNPCFDPNFAKNNAKTCQGEGSNPAGNNGGSKAPVVVLPPGNAAAGGLSVQGNAVLGDPRCVDATFLKNNPKTCAIAGNAEAGVPYGQK